MQENLLLHMLGSFPDIPGKKVFQKLCYFLQEGEGGRLGVRFRMKHYGPFSEELDAALDDLKERQLITISGSREDGYQIALRPDAKVGAVKAEDEAAVTRLKERLGGQLSHGLTLELLGTLHILAGEQPYDGSAGAKDRLVEQVRAWKGKKFDDGFIRVSIERLETIGYLTPS
jgi:hypothetical protein